VNGKLAGEKAATGMFDAALDQFGPHSRLIAPTGVESSYNYDRGGDIDELRIYDRMLSDDNIATLARNEVPQSIPPLTRTLATKDWQKEWWFDYGWDRPNDIPTPLEGSFTTVRKVEIHDAYDLKRWWWKATDGTRENYLAWRLQPLPPDRAQRLLPASGLGLLLLSRARPLLSTCPTSRRPLRLR
jgi:hypothetical protein